MQPCRCCCCGGHGRIYTAGLIGSIRRPPLGACCSSATRLWVLLLLLLCLLLDALVQLVWSQPGVEACPLLRRLWLRGVQAWAGCAGAGAKAGGRLTRARPSALHLFLQGSARTSAATATMRAVSSVKAEGAGTAGRGRE